MVSYRIRAVESTPLSGGEVFHVDSVVDGSHHPCHIHASESVVPDHGVEHVVRSIVVTIYAKANLRSVLGDVLPDGSRFGIAHVFLSFL